MLILHLCTFVASAHIVVIRHAELNGSIKRKLLARVERKRLLDLFRTVSRHEFVFLRIAASGIAKLTFGIFGRIELRVFGKILGGGQIHETVVVRTALTVFIPAFVNGQTAFPVCVYRTQPIRIHFVVILCTGGVQSSACSPATIVDIGDIGNVVIHKFNVLYVLIERITIFSISFKIQTEFKKIINRIQNARIRSAEEIHRVILGDYSCGIVFKRR